jgi:hypothetical protein
VITGAVENERSMAARGDLAADGGEMQRHCLGIGRRHDQACRDAALRTGSTEQIGPVVAPIARCARSRPMPGPDPGQGALLANPGLVLT